ncbi:MAG: MFS transporter [Candidatus Jordarchaeum sp.]|uniref:MFS transporter n=1 Tax=Candidatus Jordarchaeum sp. TaxID=2823881 RepID=UPI0040499C66
MVTEQEASEISMLKPNAIMFFANVSIATSFIIIPLFAKDLGASDTMLGIIGAGYGLALLVSSYIFGWAADVTGRRVLLLAGLLSSAVMFSVQFLVPNATVLGITWSLAGFCGGIYPQALIAYGYELRKKLGKFVSYGSLGWGLGNLMAGILAIYWEVFLFAGLFFFLGFIVALRMPISDVKLKVPLFPKHVIKRNISIYIAFFMRHTGAYATWIIFPLFLSQLGASEFWIGILYALNSFGQFFMMRPLDRFKSTSLVIAGLSFSALTFALYFLAQNFWQTIPMQLVLALSWSLLYIGSLKFVAESGVERGTSVGLLNLTLSLSTVVGPLIGGVISQIWGYRYTMLFALVMVLAGLVFFTLYLRHNKNNTQESQNKKNEKL